MIRGSKGNLNLAGAQGAEVLAIFQGTHISPPQRRDRVDGFLPNPRRFLEYK